MSAPLRVAIVGAGISGLAAAHRLRELTREAGRELRLTVFEQQPQPGGPLRTVREDGLVLEAGPDQLVTHKASGLALCERLGLGTELVEIRGPGFAPRVLHDGRPTALPAGLAMMAPTRLAPLLGSSLLSWRGKTRVALERFVPRRVTGDDESLSAFVERRFGRELLERVAEPILAGIFTADADRMSMEMTLPRFLALERRHGSVTRGFRAGGHGGAAAAAVPRRAALVSLRDGWGRLVERLVERLGDGALRCAARIERVERAGGGWRLLLEGQAPFEADRVILACPAWVSARLLDWDAELAASLGRLDYAGCATVYLLYPPGAASTPLEGSGYFVPRSAGLPVLATSYVSNKFPERSPRGTILLRVFLGGARHPRLLELEDGELVAAARRHVEAVLGLRGALLCERVYRYPRSMPQFAVGARRNVEDNHRLAGRHGGLYVCGGAAGATGLPDCIASGERAAAATLEPGVPAAAARPRADVEVASV